MDGREVVTVRMYASLRDIWNGFQKNFFPAFRRTASFWLFLALHFGLFFLPAVLLITPILDGAVWAAAAVTVALVVLMRVMLTLRFRYPLWTVVFHPFAELFLIALGLTSWWNFRIGGGVVWKGRTYRGGIPGDGRASR